ALDLAVGPAGAKKRADRLRQLLLDIEADAGAAPIGSHRIDVGGQARRLRQRHPVVEIAGAAPAQENRELDLAWLTPQRMSLLDFADQLKLLEGRIECAAARADAACRRDREIEHAATHCPAAGVPLRGCAIGVAPAVAGIVEGAGID